ncbi:MAG: DUF177 domain-containing protein [Selenomonadaceae bacterium]|nr:DUF177 domain-containing protein [Selenomonadaceae bacterium]
MLKVQIGGVLCVPFEFEVSAADFCGDDFLENGKLVGEIKIVGEVAKDDENLKIRGKIFCQRKFICDRCLNAAEEDQIHDFEEELDSGEIVDNFFDITDIVHDTLMISQPIKNLCKTDCRGLCPVCGKNLNEGSCECEKFIPDPRLADLQNFKPN